MFLVFQFLSLFSGFINKCYKKFFTKYFLSPRMHSSWAGWPAYTFFKSSFNCFLGTTTFISLLLIVICSTRMEVVFQMNTKHCYCWVIRFYPFHLSCIYLQFPFLSSLFCLLKPTFPTYVLFHFLYPTIFAVFIDSVYLYMTLSFPFMKNSAFLFLSIAIVSCRAFLSCSCSKTKTKIKTKRKTQT